MFGFFKRTLPNLSADLRALPQTFCELNGYRFYRNLIANPNSGMLTDNYDVTIPMKALFKRGLRENQEFIWGRNESSEIHNPSVSHKHLGITKVDNYYKIRDLGSRYGTHYLIPGHDNWIKIVPSENFIEVPKGTIIRTNRLEYPFGLWFQLL